MIAAADLDQPLERADLATFGYQQEPHRRVGSVASAAASAR